MMVTKEVVLGKVAAVGRKTYNASTQYHVLDIVAKDGQSYMALKDNVGIDPSTDSIEGTWMLEIAGMRCVSGLAGSRARRKSF